jgi:hypothetical protein
MAGERNHYEAAFSSLLAASGARALALHEGRRPVWQGRELKHFDFLVNGRSSVLALDLKGRRESPWVTRTDLFSMLGWRSLLAGKAEPGFAFAFFTQPGEEPPRAWADVATTAHATPAGVYRFTVLALEDAQRIARPRSARWGTLGFDWSDFTRVARSLESLVEIAPEACAR